MGAGSTHREHPEHQVPEPRAIIRRNLAPKAHPAAAIKQPTHAPHSAFPVSPSGRPPLRGVNTQAGPRTRPPAPGEQMTLRRSVSTQEGDCSPRQSPARREHSRLSLPCQGPGPLRLETVAEEEGTRGSPLALLPCSPAGPLDLVPHPQVLEGSLARAVWRGGASRLGSLPPSAARWTLGTGPRRATPTGSLAPGLWGRLAGGKL